MPTTIHTILDEFREAATSKRDMGDKFERLVVAYLKTDPIYSDIYSDVWLWNDWPHKGKKPDTGIDLVAQERATGEYCAIQCKFYAPDYSLQKSDIDSFFTASGKEPFTSRIIVSTTSHWSNHAEEALQNQRTPCIRLDINDLATSPIDWSQFSLNRPHLVRLNEKKKLRDHQKEALKDVIEGLKKADRGKLIMACGTGKTFTALKIAEKMVGSSGHVLFLVPSISLISQSLKEWAAETETPAHFFTVCSDTKVGKGKTENEDISVHDLPFPSTTDPKLFVKRLSAFKDKKRMVVVFSTYQSIEVISEAQKMGAPAFDLVICDEAHRTTGFSLADEVAKGKESHFIKVHDSKFLKAEKRLYMTATPRLYSDDSKTKAKEADAYLCSMDDEFLYGKELHRLDFSKAVGDDLLSDYKVLVLAVDQDFVSQSVQDLLKEDSELKLPDAVKIIGCWNGLNKRFNKDCSADVDPGHMKRAVAFSQSIKYSVMFKRLFPSIIDEYRKNDPSGDSLLCQVDHVDGTMNALVRNKALDWLKEETSDEGNVCRILSNARCLTEGVDVPALDAILFLNPRNSQIDVVQAVGRVMRKSPGKKYGYIILPIGVPASEEPDKALTDNKKYKVVWQVLQALRAHDNRFDIKINQLDLNNTPPDQIQIIGVGGGDTDPTKGPGDGTKKPTQITLPFPQIEVWKKAIYARIVLKCGDRQYWEGWASDVADIAKNHKSRIESLLKGAKPKHKAAFDNFLEGLQNNINPSIDKDEAIEMLSQHIITKPVFDALFEGYKFTENNPVSVAMQKMLELLEGESLKKETAKLDKFYASVRERAKASVVERASGIDNTAGKQRIISELYEKFFKSAFPKMAERLGIVYTPVEVVDFIVKSADEILKQEFGVGLTDKDVHILDPFTGTGTFIVRLLQNGLIKSEDLKRKFREELHANEIVLLAYYIAAINIEEAYHGLLGGEYEPFEGIVLTDTFQMSEPKSPWDEKYFPENNERVTRQKKTDIKVIIGNPPYSTGQDSENDANKNMNYEHLDNRISDTYANSSKATLVRNLYDSYIRAFRWCSDRIGDNGVVCFVTNGSFIEKNSMDGFRKCLNEEFSKVYCLNLRGDFRKFDKDEGENIFGSDCGTTVAITLLVKNKSHKGENKIHYLDIGERLSKKEKLACLTSLNSINFIDWVTVKPNRNNDWLNQRNPEFESFTSIGNRKSESEICIFDIYSFGVITSRDIWAFNFSKKLLASNMNNMIEFYNKQVSSFRKRFKNKKLNKEKDIISLVDSDKTKISWSRGLKRDLLNNKEFDYNAYKLVKSVYRPFCKQWVYFDKSFNEMVYRMPALFPNSDVKNVAISVVSPGARQDFSAFIVDTLPEYHLSPDGAQCFPMYYFEENSFKNDLFNQSGSDKLLIKEAVSDGFLSACNKVYKTAITKADIFYYVYGILHSAEYKDRFKHDLKKMLPRIPFASDFSAFSKSGKLLSELHLNYESAKPFPLEEAKDQFDFGKRDFYKLRKMTFGPGKDKSTIIYNNHITLKGIPLETYEYKVNGRSALEWVLDQFQVYSDPDSQITNDPNDWSDDPRYILDLVKRIVTVSLETIKIVKSLPPLNEKK